MKSVALSVLMPVYNAELYLKYAIESILDQSFRNFEFLIINDCSTDSTGEIIDHYQARDRRIIRIDNHTNLGLSRSLNDAMARSQAPVLARMDGDDISLPKRFDTQLNFLHSHPEIGVLGGLYQQIDQENNITSGEVAFPTLPDFIKWCFFFYNPIVHPCVMMRKNMALSVGGYNAAVERSQDKDLWVRLFWITQFSNIAQTLIYLRKHDTNISITGYEKGLIHNAIILSPLISKLVGYQIKPEIVQEIYQDRYSSLERIRAAVRIMSDLYFGFIKQLNPSEQAKMLIKRDIYHRVGSLIYKLPENDRQELFQEKPELTQILQTSL